MQIRGGVKESETFGDVIYGCPLIGISQFAIMDSVVVLNMQCQCYADTLENASRSVKVIVGEFPRSKSVIPREFKVLLHCCHAMSRMGIWEVSNPPPHAFFDKLLLQWSRNLLY